MNEQLLRAIREAHMQRQMYMRARIALTNQIKSCYRRLGFDKKQVAAEMKRAPQVLAQRVDGGGQDFVANSGHCRSADPVTLSAAAGDQCFPALPEATFKVFPGAAADPMDAARLAAAIMTLPLVEAAERVLLEENRHEKALAKMAAELPAADFCDDICGFALGSLGAIVGEAGDLANYPTVAKLWKRMGLAVFDGRAQRRSTDKVLAKLYGFSPRRRAVMYRIGDSLIKKQNRYREIYLARKTYERQRSPEASKGHIHRRAQRYMEKQLLKHLWQHWRRVSGRPAKSDLPDRAEVLLSDAPIPMAALSAE